MSAASSVHLFPVRHHSPRTSQVLLRSLEEVRPDVVLVEGPEDATSLVSILADKETAPPVAILGYRTGETPGSCLWPFASYSPEYVALAWAVREKKEARFIDVSAGHAIAARDVDADADRDADADGDSDANADADADLAPIDVDANAPPEVAAPGVAEQIAKARGFRSFEEFWEASFEAPSYEPAAFREALLAYADLVRIAHPSDYHRARDVWMADKIADVVAAGTKPEKVFVVLGAAHAAAIAAGDLDEALKGTLAKADDVAVTLVPYSFPRLAEQTGYGAGNRAPRYYQRAFDNGCDFRRATIEVFREMAEHLRMRGFVASLADTIEAYRLACMLADIRGKAAPGLDEVRESAVATMCRGDATNVDSFLWPTVIGRGVGKVASRIGKNSLQEEFWREVGARGLPREDQLEEFLLKMTDAVQVETSTFLHRLRVADVPYAAFVGTQGAAQRGRKVDQDEEAGGLSALSRVKEVWQAQWTPSTDVALVERVVMGDSLSAVCERVLAERAANVADTASASQILLEAVVTASPRAISTALQRTDELAATDDSFPSLARACRALSTLVTYGTARARAKATDAGGGKKSGGGDDAIGALCMRTWERAVLRVRSGCTGDDDATREARAGLRMLHEVAQSQSLVDPESWFTEARDLVDDWSVHPACAGLAAGLLYLAQRIDEAGVALVVGQRVSTAAEPEKAAQFLEGFLEVSSLALVKSRAVVEALDGFMAQIEKERFKDVLPMLRRAFGALGPTERRYLLENLVAVRKIGDGAKEAARVLTAKDKEALAAASDEVAKALDDLDDLL